MKRNYPDIHLIYSKTLLWLCCLFSLLSGCSSSTDEEATIPPPAPSKVNLYKVAVIMPLSDTSAKEKCERTVAWAQETIYELTVGDENCVQLDVEWYNEDTEDMEQLAMRLAYREDLYAIIGPYASQNVEIIARECAVSHKPLIAPTASSADLVRLYAQEGFLWSLVETDISQCETLLSIALEEDCRRISLIASDDIYGQTFIDWFAFQANELGVSVDKVLKYTIGQPEAAMCEALSTSPEALICVPGKPADVRKMLEQHDKESATRLLFSDNAFQTSVIESCGDLAEEIEGVGTCADPETGFDIAYKVRFGEAPTWEAYLYDAAFLTLMGVYDLQVNGGTDLNTSLRKMTISDENTDNQQGAWMPGLLWVKMLGIQFQSYTCLNGASGLLAFDKNVYTNVLHSTYCHWMIYRKNFLVLDYHTTDGSHRTNANLAGWNWKKEKEQEFDSGLKEPEYPALKECWAVIIAASRGWSNYRHQADALAFYQLLKSRGYDDEHIILIEEDDIAGHPSNFDPGKVYISPDGTDVYEGAVIDYKLSELSLADLVDIFCGKRSDRLPHVVSSGEQDNVLVFWSGHGMQGNLLWGDADNFSHWQAAELFDTLHRRRKYRKMLWLVETCYAGSVAKACEGIPGIMCMTASGEWETSKPDIPYKSVWLSNRFTYSLLSELTARPEISLRELYYSLFRTTIGSHVQIYNERNYGSVYRNNMKEYLQKRIDE